MRVLGINAVFHDPAGRRRAIAWFRAGLDAPESRVEV
jgi:hypothetical protein